jgi:ribosomal protein S18 acetylase RimI-like enzyme
LTASSFAVIVVLMPDQTETRIRPFDGKLEDAYALLAVEQATFDESPYLAEQVCDMLTTGPQRAWLAVVEGQVVGFVIAFPTCGLAGPRWEIDLLAVLPAWRGHGLAAALLQRAAEEGSGVAPWARGVVADDNDASTKAFTRAGFTPERDRCNLLIYRPERGLARPPAAGLSIRTVSSPHRAASLPAAVLNRPAEGSHPDSEGPYNLLFGMAQGESWLPGLPASSTLPGPTLLLAEQAGQPAGYAELIRVQTLLYEGLWLESVSAPARQVRDELVREALTLASEAGLDEVGAMVPEPDWPLQHSLLAAGFRSLGTFRWFTAPLPLPKPATPRGPVRRS